ncbi:MAG: PadR family transcriptional regulator [Nitrososphaeria archaeon]|nr:PadR family transcriptional regulator [Nitrososphaeria archaeon]MDW8043631.1 PadR family transcriptional regulator [Nitrososphaerota archaeon]
MSRWLPSPVKGLRLLARGDMRLLVLEVLRDGPKRGYEVMSAIREMFLGIYSPSPGAVYPTLQMLEDEGLVASEEVEGKRVYRITERGLAFLEERRDLLDELLEKGRRYASAEGMELMDASRDLAASVLRAYATLPPEDLKEVAQVLRDARARVLSILGRRGLEGR